MALGAATDNTQTALCQSLGNGLGVFHHLLLVGFEVRRHRFFESDGFGSNHVHQRTALQAREDRAVNRLLMLCLHQNNAAARTTQAFVGGGCHHVSMGHRVGVDTRSNQARIVRHVHQENRAHVFRHFGKTCEVDMQTVGRSTGND